jgi:AmiR/NasT family two-component response regulator
VVATPCGFESHLGYLVGVDDPDLRMVISFEDAPRSLIAAATATMCAMTGPPTDAEKPHRVLVAEDEALIRLDLAEMLREEGYEVVGEAGDGQEAVDLAERLKPDLVIMDVKMPRRDGIDAASEIASKRIAPIVILTAFSQRDLVERARDAGAMAYLVKPFNITDLIPAIEVAVSRFSEISALEQEVATLSDRLETRKLVERAKGLLQAKQGMTEPEAFKWIQRAAMDRRTTMKRVAEVVLETLDEPKDASPSS